MALPHDGGSIEEEAPMRDGDGIEIDEGWSSQQRLAVAHVILRFSPDCNAIDMVVLLGAIEDALDMRKP